MSSAPPRRLDSWIDAFLDFTEPRKSPQIFRKWAAISALSGAMERKIFALTETGPLYPSIFVFLVGPPAAGKTVALKAAEGFLRKLSGIHIAPTNLSGAAMMDALNESKRVIINVNQPPVEYRSMVLFSSELSSLLPVYDNDIMGRLTDIYDCEHVKEFKRGGNLRIDIPKPFLTLLGCCTPEYLNNFLPEGAWGQGFMSRVIMIFCDATQRRSLFGNIDEHGDPTKSPAFKALEDDLTQVFNLMGRMRFSHEAAELLQTFENTGGLPQPSHHKLINYIGRRTVNLIKLSMIASVSRTSDLLVSLEDFQTAHGWLMEAETYMGDIFKAMGTGGTDSQAIQDAWEFVFESYTRGKFQPISEHLLVNFIMRRVPPNTVMRVIELLRTSNMVERTFDPSGRALYKPIARDKHMVG